MAHAYGVNGEFLAAEGCLSAAVYLGLPEEPKITWMQVPELRRKEIIRELKDRSGVTSHDLIKLIRQRPVSKTFTKPDRG